MEALEVIAFIAGFAAFIGGFVTGAAFVLVNSKKPLK